MSQKNPKNIAASVRQKILNKSRSEHLRFSALLQYYAMERFLYRLSVSKYSKDFILKGALLLRAWGLEEYRPTMDIDLLGLSSNNSELLVSQIADICSQPVSGDGLVFDINSIKAEQITVEADYIGNRIIFSGKLDTIKIKMQIDIGFGDSVYPEPIKCSLPGVIDFPIAKLMCYQAETTVAEKFEAMVNLGDLNSRIKDFFDIILLAQSGILTQDKLSESIIKTFAKRGTPIPKQFTEYSDNFIKIRQKAWVAFIKKNDIRNITEDFKEVIYKVKLFINPILETCQSKIN